MSKRSSLLPDCDSKFEEVSKAAEECDIHTLGLLRLAGKWTLEHRISAVEAAEEADRLIALLAACKVPLGLFPHHAHSQVRQAVKVIDEGLADKQEWWQWAESGLGRTSNLWRPPAPSPQANLLANYLSVPSPAAEKFMHGLVEDMVVFTSSDSLQKRKDNKVKAAMYVSQRVREADGDLLVYNGQAPQVTLPHGEQTFKTSSEYQLRLSSASRRAGLIPLTATAFTYVFPKAGLPDGGFLYLRKCDGKVSPMALNALSFARKPYELAFGGEVDVTLPSDEQYWETEQRVSEESLRQAGYKHYRWVDPDIPGTMGGFAFKSGNGKSFFLPRDGCGKDRDRYIKFTNRLPTINTKGSFPAELGAMYLQREIVVRPGGPEILYKPEEHYLQFGQNGTDVRTSNETEVTLEGEARRAALIPTNAKTFVFVYGGDQDFLAKGGFLYLDGDKRPVAVNSISFEPRRCALCFGKYEEVSGNSAKELSKRAQEVSAERLLQAGATHYAWVGPGEEFGDLVAPSGGFAYLFEDERLNRFFSILAASEVVDRADMSGELSLEMLPKDADATEIEQYVTETLPRNTFKPTTCLSRLTSRFIPQSRRSGVSVTLARLKVPRVLHPLVLHGLAWAPRCQVFGTLAAKAIGEAAFKQNRKYVLIDLLLEFLSILAVARFTRMVRTGDLFTGNWRGDSFQTWALVITYPILVLVFFKNVVAESSIVVGHFYWDLHGSYITMNRLMNIAHFLMMLALIAWVTRSIAGTLLGAGAGSREEELRTLLATVSVMKWTRVLFAFSGFEIFRLGPRILPILGALGECIDFIVIMMFFGIACVQAAYALSDEDGWNIFVKTYRLAFLGDFEVEEEGEPHLIFLPHWDGNPNSSFPYLHWAFFITFSFVLAVSMTNIFIGVMSNAFDHYSDRADLLFVKRRASLGLDYTLQAQGLKLMTTRICRCCRCGCRRRKQKRCEFPAEENFLWFCCRQEEEGGDDDQTNKGNSLRGLVRKGQLHIESEIRGLRSDVDSLRKEKNGGADGRSPTGASRNQPLNLEAFKARQTLASYTNLTRHARKLHITIQGANNLRNADWQPGSKSDPYCACQVKGRPHTRFRTKVCKDTLDPEWNEKDFIQDFDDDDELEFSIYDDDSKMLTTHSNSLFINNIKGDDSLGRHSSSIALILAELKDLTLQAAGSREISKVLELDHSGTDTVSTLSILAAVEVCGRAPSEECSQVRFSRTEDLASKNNVLPESAPAIAIDTTSKKGQELDGQMDSILPNQVKDT